MLRTGFTLLIIFTLILPSSGQEQSVSQDQEKEAVIKGRVVNSVTNEPVPFATVIIFGTTTGAMTDFDGNFLFTGVTPGYVRLQGSSVGFESYVTPDVLVTLTNPVYIEIPLTESVVGIDDVVVKASPFRKQAMSPLSVRIIGIQEIEKNPGGNRDISRVIQSFPGVASTPAFRNDVIVRGGGPNENRFYLDDIEIPYLNHFSTQGASGGPVGIINVDFVEELNFYSGAFPASRGNALSSVLNFRQIDGNRERLKFRATVGASDLGLTLDGPTGERSSLILSARRSYLQFLFKAIGLPFLPTYNDFQFKHKTRIGETGELTIIGLGALDDFVLNRDANETEYQRYLLDNIPVQEQYSYTIGVRYKQFRNNGYDTWVISRNYLNNSQYKYAGNIEGVDSLLLFDYLSGEGENKFRYERSLQTENGIRLEYGAGYENVLYRTSSVQKIFSEDEVLSRSYDVAMRTNKFALFGQGSKSFLDNRLSLSFGIRADASSYSSEMSNPLRNLSPRFSASWSFNEELSFNFNTGRYHQLPPYTAMGYSDAAGNLVNRDNGLKYIRSDHFVAGLEFQPENFMQFTLEGFYKLYSDYPFSVTDSIPLASKSAEYGIFGDEEVIPVAEGRSYGAEFLARIRNLNGLNLVLSYTLVRSEFKDMDGRYIPTSCDNRHLLNLTATKQLKGNWDIGLKWRYVGGAPYTPYDLELSSVKEAWDLTGQGYFDYSRYNSERLQAFHQLDLRVDKGWFFDNWTLMVYADVQNIYNFKADQPPILLRESDETGMPLTDPTDSNRYQLKYISGESGTVLPTVGIIVEF
jgi:hypothetical protein